MLKFDFNSSDQIMEWLEEIGWSLGESGRNGEWTAFAARENLRFEGTGFKQNDARQDLIQKMLSAGKASTNGCA